MKTLYRKAASRILALLIVSLLAMAQSGAQAQTAHSFSQQELDQMLAPIALYPDVLLSQILTAATYPLEVVEAARWAGDHPGLSGDEAISAAVTEGWDASVLSLVAFPQVLAQMREHLQWTQDLGNAFRDQQVQMLDTVQALRRRAQAAGNLRPDERANLIENGPNLLLQPYDPRVVYVPYYDPQVVYGQWWWPSSPPAYLRPAAVHYSRPVYTAVFYLGPPVRVSARVFFRTIDWGRREARAPAVRYAYTLPVPRPVPAAAIQIRTEPRRFDHPGAARIHPVWNAPIRVAPNVRFDLARTAPSHSVHHPAQIAVRHETYSAAVTRHEPTVRHQSPPSGAPRAEFRPPQAAAHRETHAPARPKPSR